MKNLKKFIPPVKKPRLSGWLLTSVLLLGTIALVSPQQLPVVIYKLALITLAAVLGYWLDRSLFPKARPGQYLKHDDRLMADGRFPVQTGLHLVFSAALIRRALIVAAVCLAVAMGLYPDTTQLELRRELDYLADRKMVELEKRPSGDWFADLSRLGVDIVEYTVECGPGIARPEKYWSE
ncbi:hypothetical protein BMN62_003805 [Escherichia coli]|nr:hypothetical protein [Escherichia coli]HAM9017222.1 hypothetical protein [Escherichia coli]HAM9357137.1 hypothetical protein [Escherichia coli]